MPPSFGKPNHKGPQVRTRCLSGLKSSLNRQKGVLIYRKQTICLAFKQSRIRVRRTRWIVRKRGGSPFGDREYPVGHQPDAQSDDAHLGIMSLDNVSKARAFHKSFPQYSVTPLARLDGQAARLGLATSASRTRAPFGLQRVQGPGGSSPWPTTLPTRPARDVADCTYDYLTSDELASDFGQATFFTATDGNHGRGVPGRQQARPEGRRAHARVVPPPASTTSPPRAPR